MNICTIIAKNYVAHARVLAESFVEHHPDGTCFVLIIDEFNDDQIDPATEPFTILTPADLDLAEADFDDMRAMYNVLEFSTAVKPWLLARMLDTYDDGSGIAYFDPDIRVYSRMEELEQALRATDIVLTPHLTQPMPRDGMKPSETDIMIAGIYNLGFVGLSAGADTDALLAFWKERLRSECWVAPERGLFVDQKWIDWVPGLLTNFIILRVPTYNVAYWNIPTREFARGDHDTYTVDGLPLRFFHFSGYGPHRREHFSKHQNRVPLIQGTPLHEICDEYGDRLLANDFDAVQAFPYGHNTLPSGEQLDQIARDLYVRGTQSGDVQGSIFTARGELDFVAWMNQAKPESPGVTRYLHELWRQRPDLRLAYPDINGVDRLGFLGWCRVFGREQVPISERMLNDIVRSAETGPRDTDRADRGDAGALAEELDERVDRPFGVTVAGYFRSELGIGEVARQVVQAMDTASIPTAPRILHTPNSRQGHRFAAGGQRDYPYPVNLIFVNADGLPAFAEEATEAFFRDRYSIGYWWWELPDFPEKYFDAFDLVDEIWVGSTFVANAIARHATKPVVTVPVPIDLAIPAPLKPGELGWPSSDQFTFHFSWDYNSVYRRKNPLGLVQAYRQAFEPGDGATLVLKCINAELDSANHAELVAAITDRKDIVLIDRYVAARDKNRLISTCDCYVSLHRSEGLGLTMAEAMLMGKPVIATNYSGNTDFMTSQNSYPVDYQLAPVGPGAFPYDPESEWAEPNLEHAAALMREVFNDRSGAAARGAIGADNIRATYSPEAVGATIAARLQRIRGSVSATSLVSISGSRRDRDHVSSLVRRGTLPRAPSRFGKPGAALRKLVLRIIKPYSAYQSDVNAALLRQFDELQASISDLTIQNLAKIERVENAQVQDLSSVLAELRANRGLIEELRETVATDVLHRHR